MPIDLNAAQPAGSPVRMKATGTIGVLTLRDGFSDAWSNALAAAGLAPDSFAVSFGLFSTGFSADIVCRTTGQVVTAGQVAFVVRNTGTATGGGTIEAVTVLDIGKPGDVVHQAGGGAPGWIQELIDWLKKIGDTLGTATKTIIVLAAIALLVWILAKLGGVRTAREAFA